MEFRLFGPLEVIDPAGRVIDLGTPKQRAVLAMLALEPGRVVSLDRLIDELWSGEAPSSATGTLQAYISQLRRALEPGRPPRTPPKVLLTREPGYLLAVAPGQVDLVRFAALAEDGRRSLARGEPAAAADLLRRALETWRGEPLAEFAAYEFAQPVVARLTELRASATEDWFEARLATGEGGSCVPGLESAVAGQPYRERSWALLVRALYRAGRQADALAALRRVRTLLADELGLEPGPELRRLEQAVLGQAPGLETPPAAAEHGTDGVPGAPVVPDDRTVPDAAGDAPAVPAEAGRTFHAGGLIARREQLQRAAERLALARRGRGGVLLVSGEAGIGKTSLAEAVADEASALGMAVAWGRCAEDTGAPAFWPWLQVLRDLAPPETGPYGTASYVGGPGGGQDVARALAALSGVAEPETADARHGLPGHGLSEHGPSGHGLSGHSAALFALHERVTGALIAAGPALVVLDDLHWADAASLRLLAFAAGALHRAPVLVLATMRPEPGGEPDQLRETSAALARERGAERLTLPPFTREDVAAYLAGRDLPDARLAAVLFERTGGNPFYLGELVRLLDSEHRLDAASAGVPEGVREVIGRRVARLPEETRALLGAAAVLGREVSLDVLEAACGTPAEEVMALLEPAVATGLLAEVPDGFDYRFSHALVRDALYTDLGRVRRARLHLRTGEALETLAGVEPSVLAHHFGMAARAGGAAKAVEYAVRAARQAAAQCAYDEAVDWWGRALTALGPADAARRCALLVGFGEALRTVGDVDRARSVLEEAIALAARIGERATLIEAFTVFGGLSVWNWRHYGVVDEEMVALLEGLLAEPAGDAERATLLGTLGLELYYSPRRAEGERLAAEGVRLARRAGDPRLLARSLNNYLVAAWVPEREEERRHAVEEMLALPLDASAEAVARIFRMANLLRAGELDEWDRDLARCRRLVELIRRPELTGMAGIAEAAGRTIRGDWAEAERLAAEFTALIEDFSMWGLDYPGLITLYTCRRGQGRVAELADRLVSRAHDADMVPLRPVAVLAALDVGDTALARRLVDRWGTRVPPDWTAEFLTVVWGYVAARLGTPDPAALLRTLTPYAERLVVSGMGGAGWGSTHLVLAELAAATGERGLALRHARRAHETHLRLGLDHWAGESARLLAEPE
ncbi:BTAD domain-containing putative transcriptional regulator [Microbispora sp. H10836]|uniref:BTAD domain-containing putative transcriptional regulator n=1 Tax=Microbispora sp. H10836 TaxID=2729106 RepID=UPI001472D491|nr:BTAD domain-containing putative transcriptional regulator [Microbispora sp. H10836]